MKEAILKNLRNQKIRITKTREILLDIFLAAVGPLSVQELLFLLKKRGVVVNKTTVYREIDFLLGQNIIGTVFIDEAHKKYELQTTHHHHLVCRNCNAVEEIEMKEIESLFALIEKKLKRQKQFQNIEHSLEFFGICKKCFSSIS